jgi:hypothetical protein
MERKKQNICSITGQNNLLPHNARECPRRDLNPHSLGETDFKSAASTIPPLGQQFFFLAIFTQGIDKIFCFVLWKGKEIEFLMVWAEKM